MFIVFYLKKNVLWLLRLYFSKVDIKTKKHIDGSSVYKFYFQNKIVIKQGKCGCLFWRCMYYVIFLFRIFWSNPRFSVLNSGRPWVGCEECWLAPHKVSTSFRFLPWFCKPFQIFRWMMMKIFIILVENWSGGKDNLVKLWDAKTGKELCSL